ncbi:hypothetical protein [Fastidiosipila sanguinis]|nr:hypothetical protein [Fastidiosipila sanguinis]
MNHFLLGDDSTTFLLLSLRHQLMSMQGSSSLRGNVIFEEQENETLKYLKILHSNPRAEQDKNLLASIATGFVNDGQYWGLLINPTTPIITMFQLIHG